MPQVNGSRKVFRVSPGRWYFVLVYLLDHPDRQAGLAAPAATSQNRPAPRAHHRWAGMNDKPLPDPAPGQLRWQNEHSIPAT